MERNPLLILQYSYGLHSIKIARMERVPLIVVILMQEFYMRGRVYIIMYHLARI